MIIPANSVEATGAEIQHRLIEHRLAKGLRAVLVEQLFSPKNIKYWQKNNGAGAAPRLTRHLRQAEFPWSADEVKEAAKKLFVELGMSADVDEHSGYMQLHVLPSSFNTNMKSMEKMYEEVAGPKHDIALLEGLFHDLSLWRESNGQRVCNLSLRKLKETVDTVTPKVKSIFATLNIPNESLTVKDAEAREAHRGEVHVAMPAQVFAEYAERMKGLLRDVKRAQGAGGISTAPRQQ